MALQRVGHDRATKHIPQMEKQQVNTDNHNLP